jgi:PEP-CTERM motif
MNNQLKAALVAVVAAGLAASAQAYNGDLLVGFWQSGVSTTLVYDLGSYSTLQNGETWNLSLQLAGAGFNTSGAGFNSGVNFGVVGYNGGTVYSTYNAGGDISVLNNNDLSATAVNTVKGGINTLGNNQGLQTVDATGKGADWASETIVGGLNTDLVNNLFNPNATGVGTKNYLYTLGSTGSLMNDNNADALGSPNNYFTISGDGTFTYGVAPVPEPSTTVLMTGLGALVFVFRRWSGRKTSA